MAIAAVTLAAGMVVVIVVDVTVAETVAVYLDRLKNIWCSALAR